MKKMAFLMTLITLNPTWAQSDAERIAKLETIVESLQDQNKRNMHFTVDYRVTHDSLDYKLVDGSHQTNDSLLANRLHFHSGYVYNENLSFSANFAYNKAFGASANHGQRINLSGAYSTFDWITNEKPNGNEVKMKEVYFLYRNKTFLGTKVPWTFSLGRRPSTNGFLITHREGFEKPQSPLGHAINSEYDGMSINFKLEDVTGVPGSQFKICIGRGLSNAVGAFVLTQPDYTRELDQSTNIDMGGFITTLYNDGQYDLKTLVYHAKNLIGQNDASTKFLDFGDLSSGTVSFEMRGIGDLWSDFLEDTTIFASYSFSKTHPQNGLAMLGDTTSKTGSSYWAGVIIPWFFKDGDRMGFEYNHGSRYWRSFSYAEDTLIGSKIATRGDAYEVYYNLPLIDKAFTFQVRYTYLDYNYDGSNGFFGEMTGTPVDLSTLTESEKGSYVSSASALRVMFRYKY